MNETFCRALLRAGLTEDDVAARLGVDLKTVRRWVEGKALPYRRHRWALAALLSTAETDLWPQLRGAQPRPDEVVAIYPHLSTVPQEARLRLFGSAQHEISNLDNGEVPLGRDRDVVKILAERARAGIRVRICVAERGGTEASTGPGAVTPTAEVHGALQRWAPLRESGAVEIRLHEGVLYTFLYRADDQLLIGQRVYGVPADQAPALHLHQAAGGGMFATYLDSFERIWAQAHPLPGWPAPGESG